MGSFNHSKSFLIIKTNTNTLIELARLCNNNIQEILIMAVIK